MGGDELALPFLSLLRCSNQQKGRGSDPLRAHYGDSHTRFQRCNGATLISLLDSGHRTLNYLDTEIAYLPQRRLYLPVTRAAASAATTTRSRLVLRVIGPKSMATRTSRSPSGTRKLAVSPIRIVPTSSPSISTRHWAFALNAKTPGSARWISIVPDIDGSM